MRTIYLDENLIRWTRHIRCSKCHRTRLQSSPWTGTPPQICTRLIFVFIKFKFLLTGVLTFGLNGFVVFSIQRIDGKRRPYHSCALNDSSARFHGPRRFRWILKSELFLRASHFSLFSFQLYQFFSSAPCFSFSLT